MLALRVAYHLNDAFKIAISHQRLGQEHVKIGDYSTAIQEYKLSEHHLKNISRSKNILFVMSDLSEAYLLAGNLENAKEIASQVIQEAERLKHLPEPTTPWPEEKAIAAATLVLADIDFTTSNYQSAVVKYYQAYSLYQQLNDSTLPIYTSYILRVLNSIGTLFSATGQYRQGLLYFNKALKIARERRDKEVEASVLHNLGVLYLRQGNLEQAEKHIRQNLEPSLSQRDYSLIATSNLNLGIIAMKQGDNKSAVTHFQICQRYAQKIQDEELSMLLSQHLGALRQAEGDYAGALAEFQRSEASAKAKGYQLRLAESLWHQSEALRFQQRIQESILKAEAALQLAQRLSQPRLVQLAALSIAHGYIIQKQYDKAMQMLTLSVDYIEKVRQSIAGEETGRQVFLGKRVETYHLIVNILAQQHYLTDALLYTERVKARVLYDHLTDDHLSNRRSFSHDEKAEEQIHKDTISDLNRQLLDEQLKTKSDVARIKLIRDKLTKARHEYSSFRDLLKTSHPDIIFQPKIPLLMFSKLLEQASRNPEIAYLSYLVTADRVHIFTLSRSSNKTTPVLRLFTVNIKHSELIKRVNRFHSMMAQRHPLYQPEARELYDLLVKPVEVYLQGATTLCIIPDDILWDLSFQALQSKENRFLIEDYAIYYAPSLSILNELDNRRPSTDIPATASASTTFLAFGNPTPSGETVRQLQDSQSHLQFEPLPEAEVEVRAIGDLFPADRRAVYIGAQASEARFKAEAPSHDILHLATHGVIDNANPLYSYLLLSSADGDGEDGLLEAREVLDLNLCADTVVLSACETARGRIGAGEGVIGMTWAFFGAGARTAVVSQWRVDSQATAAMMADFHSRLRAGVGKPEAMRQTVLAMQRGERRLSGQQEKFDPRYHHPFYWAAFMVIGSPR